MLGRFRLGRKSVKEKGIATAVVAAVIVVALVVVGIGAYFMLKGPEGVEGWTFEGLRISGDFIDPEVFQLPDGNYRMHFSDIEFETAGLFVPVVASSPDGLTWTIESWTENVAWAAPSIIKLPDGQYRIYSSNGFDTPFMTAVSSDGHNWENATGCTFPYIENALVPSVIILPDGTYRMYYTRGFPTETYMTSGGEVPVHRIYSAHSSDGLVWELDPGIRIDGAEEVDRGHASSCDVYIREDGKYEMVYVSGGYEIYWAVSDDGLNWTRIGYTGLEGLDPIINVFPDGTIRMYYAIAYPTVISDKPVGIYSAIREPI